MFFRNSFSLLLNNIQQQLFPLVENYVGKISDQYKKLISILELVRIEDFIPCTRFNLGRRCCDHAPIARAFIAKFVLKISYTKQLIERLQADTQLRVICGWDSTSKIPSESKFSRTFKKFVEASVPDKAHERLIKKFYENEIIGHITKDSTPIIARERALKKEGTKKERKKLSNKRYQQEIKGEIKGRRQKQLTMELNEAIAELPKRCDIGCKKSSQGYLMAWKGYKLHMAISDNCMPVCAILTSASLNDCEVAIPLANKANQLVQNFYDLMDSAYDVAEVKEHSIMLGHVPIIDENSRGKAKKEKKEAETKGKKILNFSTAEDKRYKNRFPTERCNALFKDFYGGRCIFYRGHSKVFCHSMFGLTALTASIVLKFI